MMQWLDDLAARYLRWRGIYVSSEDWRLKYERMEYLARDAQTERADMAEAERDAALAECRRLRAQLGPQVGVGE